MKHMKTERNRGYSFVEMLIVLAIMALMSAMAIVTWNAVDSAKYRNAVSTFESEISTLRTATMAQGSEMALKVYYDSNYKDRFGKQIGAYIIKRGYVDDMGDFHEINKINPDALPAQYSHLANSVYYDYRGVSDPIYLTQKGKINYSASGVGLSDIGDAGVVSQFNKSDGSLLSGSGTFQIVKANGTTVANVNIVRITGAYYETY